MKYFTAALILGCSALACKFAVQSNLFTLNVPRFVEAPDIRRALSRVGFELPPFLVTPPATVTVTAEKPEKPMVKLGREETLLLIRASAEKHLVPASFVKSIIAAESNFDSTAVSPKGAIGLMQLMPGTAEEYGADPRIPEQNVDAGTRYLRVLMNRYSKQRDPLKRVIAAYNAGPGNVDRYRGVPPFRETRTYVKRVMGYLQQFEGSGKRTPITLAMMTKS